MLPEPIRQFVSLFSRLPSIGPRLATRLALHLIGLDRPSLHALASAVDGLKTLDRCPRCFFLKDENSAACDICSDTKRDAAAIAVVEKETDVFSIERTGKFKGQYMLIGELPEKGVLEESHKARIAHLKARIAKGPGGKAKEILIALNPNSFGDFMADIIRRECAGSAERITRIGRGIPTGGEIEFADEETLGSALERRI